MSLYTANIHWKRSAGESFIDKRYHRLHAWRFDGGTELPASSSPHAVPVPFSDESAIDPEEAFVAAISSCHMLVFLSLAAAKKYIVEEYEDGAEGLLATDARGRMSVTEVTLRPRVVFGGANLPSQTQISALHDTVHEQCYIANSVRTNIRIIPS